MFIDTSAFVAIFCNEPDAETIADRLQAAERLLTSAVVRLETLMVASTRLRRPPSVLQVEFDAFLGQAAIEVVAITDLTGRLAVEAFERYGKGCGSKAQLNLADCLTYACAKEHGVPILFKGRDFARTDVLVAR